MKLPEVAERGQRPRGRNEVIKDGQCLQVPAAPSLRRHQKTFISPHEGLTLKCESLFLLFNKGKGKERDQG